MQEMLDGSMEAKLDVVSIPPVDGYVGCGLSGLTKIYLSITDVHP